MTVLARRSLLALVVFFAFVAALRPAAALQSGASPSTTLVDLQGLDEFKKLFNQDVGKHRLVLLVSPT